MSNCKDLLRKSDKVEIHIKLKEFINLAKSSIERDTGVNLDNRVEPVFDEETLRVGVHLDGYKFSEKEVYDLKNYSTLEDFSNAELSIHSYLKDLGFDVNKVSIYSDKVDFDLNTSCLITAIKWGDSSYEEKLNWILW